MYCSPARVETDTSPLLLGTDVVLFFPAELASSISVCKPALQRKQVVKGKWVNGCCYDGERSFVLTAYANFASIDLLRGLKEVIYLKSF